MQFCLFLSTLCIPIREYSPKVKECSPSHLHTQCNPVINSSRSEGRRPERSEVNKFVGPARAELSRANSSEKYIYIYIYIYVCIYVYIFEGVRTMTSDCLASSAGKFAYIEKNVRA